MAQRQQKIRSEWKRLEWMDGRVSCQLWTTQLVGEFDLRLMTNHVKRENGCTDI